MHDRAFSRIGNSSECTLPVHRTSKPSARMPKADGTDALFEAGYSTTHNVPGMNAFHRVACINYQRCMLRDPLVVIISMVGHDQYTVILADVLDRRAFHLQIVMAPFTDKRKVWIVVADLSAIVLQQFNNRQGRRLAQVIDVLLVGHAKYQHLGTV